LVELRTLLELRQATPLSFFGDGLTLLVGSDLPGTRQLFLADVEGGGLTQLTDFDEPVRGQALADGRILLEMDEGGNERTQLFLLDAEPGAVPERLVVDPHFMHRSPCVDPDGTLVAYVTNRRNGVDFDVVVRTLATGEEQVFERGGWWDTVGISPDGRWVAALRLGERAGDSDLYLFNAASRKVVHATPHTGEAEYGAPAWLPDSSAFFAATSEGRDTLAIGRYELESGEWSTVVESPWDLDCVIDRVGRTLLVSANEDGRSTLQLRDPRTLELREEVFLPHGVIEQPVFTPDGALLAVAFSCPTEPHDVYLYDVFASGLSRLTTSSAEIDPDDLVLPELHRFDSFDGESVPVFLFEPEGEGPFPVVVTVHGGPEAQWRPWFAPSFAPLTQYLVSRGYAVAAPNVRGSTGYGKRYEHLDDVGKRLDSVRDLASLHDWLSARPEIDGSRAVLYGRSYGGYMVLAGLAFQPERWAAGIEMAGISSLLTFLENTSPYRRAAREREYGSLERDHELLVEVSPMTHVDAIRAPLFIQHGLNDPRVPVSESEHIHEVLTEKGIRCDLVIYPNEGHGIEKLPNRIDAFTRAVAFLDEVLG
jgi:dipeptidyl aminopeptidase/acylaminoacyl peptidase